MSESRIDAFEKMLQETPGDRRIRLFLAMEYQKSGALEKAVQHLEAYIQGEPEGDVGAAWRDLGLCLERLERKEESQEAFSKGISAAERHHHGDLAQEIRQLMET